jgi:hypothetical protein
MGAGHAAGAVRPLHVLTRNCAKRDAGHNAFALPAVAYTRRPGSRQIIDTKLKMGSTEMLDDMIRFREALAMHEDMTVRASLRQGFSESVTLLIIGMSLAGSAAFAMFCFTA